MNIAQLLKLSRPHFWLYELGTFAIGVVAALSLEVREEWWLIALYTFYFLFPANLLIYGINDVYDYETDLRNPKKAGYESVLPKSLHRPVLSVVGVSSAGFVAMAFFLPFPAMVAFFAFVFFAVFYSAPPIRAKARPFLDSFFSAGHYVATGVFGYYLAGGEGNVLLVVVAAMAWAIAMHAYSAVPDIEADSMAEVNTIATKLGGQRTIVLCGVLYVLAGVIAFFYIGWMALLLSLPYLYMMWRSYDADAVALMRLYTYFPWLNALVGMAITFIVLYERGWLL